MDVFEFNIKHQLRIDWSELDYFKHVNNVSFFKYIQSARVNYWELIGLSQSHLQTGIGAMLASTKCDFKKPLMYPGTVTILSRIDFVKTTSFGFHHLLLNNDQAISAEAKDVMVMFDFTKNEKIPIPDWMREKIKV